ncbi:hypothetical protein [Endozoicomonas arenosclerae]|uniref:hypothetical protein n=1 Tax=Endozoicomonas arenosclerae TaxID=1633495 RepID=UPI0007865D74|nr:hypothetical protein [Endozoicomonas arenosclerae]
MDNSPESIKSQKQLESAEQVAFFSRQLKLLREAYTEEASHPEVSSSNQVTLPEPDMTDPTVGFSETGLPDQDPLAPGLTSSTIDDSATIAPSSESPRGKKRTLRARKSKQKQTTKEAYPLPPEVSSSEDSEDSTPPVNGRKQHQSNRRNSMRLAIQQSRVSEMRRRVLNPGESSGTQSSEIPEPLPSSTTDEHTATPAITIPDRDNDSAVAHSLENGMGRKRTLRTRKQRNTRPDPHYSPTESSSSEDSEEEYPFRKDRKKQPSNQQVRSRRAAEQSRSTMQRRGRHPGEPSQPRRREADSQSNSANSNTVMATCDAIADDTSKTLHQQFITRLSGGTMTEALKYKFRDCLQKSEGHRSVRADNCAALLNHPTRGQPIPDWPELNKTTLPKWNTRLVKYGMYRMSRLEAGDMTPEDFAILKTDTWLYLIILVDFLNTRIRAQANFQRTPKMFNSASLGFPVVDGQNIFRESATESWTVSHCHLLIWLFDRNHCIDNDRILYNMLAVMDTSHPLYEIMLLQYIKVRLGQERLRGDSRFQFSAESPLEWCTELREACRNVGSAMSEQNAGSANINRLEAIPKPSWLGEGPWGYEGIAQFLIKYGLIDTRTLPPEEDRYAVRILDSDSESED